MKTYKKVKFRPNRIYCAHCGIEVKYMVLFNQKKCLKCGNIAEMIAKK